VRLAKAQQVQDKSTKARGNMGLLLHSFLVP